MVTIRPAAVDDAESWAQVVLASTPTFVTDAESEAHELRSAPPGSLLLVAERDGAVVGVARSRRRHDSDRATLVLMVHPDHRRQRIGSTLLDAVLAWAAGRVRRVDAIVEDDPASDAARAAWGFEVTRRFRNWALDPRTVAPPGPTPAGYRLTTTEELGPEPVWQVHQQVAADDPSGLTVPMPYDDWLAEWHDPRARHGWSTAVVDPGGSPAAYTLIGAAGDRGWSNMTGTLPRHRGRGLALLCKQHSLRAAAAHGVATCFTGNDAANGPMLAVNSRLGYRPVARPCLAGRDLR